MGHGKQALCPAQGLGTRFWRRLVYVPPALHRLRRRPTPDPKLFYPPRRCRSPVSTIVSHEPWPCPPSAHHATSGWFERHANSRSLLEKSGQDGKWTPDHLCGAANHERRGYCKCHLPPNYSQVTPPANVRSRPADLLPTQSPTPGVRGGKTDSQKMGRCAEREDRESARGLADDRQWERCQMCYGWRASVVCHCIALE